MTVVYDLLGVQSKEHGERGIARYVLSLALALAEVDPDAVDVYAIRDDLPVPGVLEPLIRTGKVHRLSELSSDPPAGGVYFVASPYELTEDLDSLIPKWARTPNWRRVGVLYDLIPLVFPDVYLNAPWASRYRARTTTVGSFDHLFAISEASKQDAVRLLSARPENVTVIAAGADDRFRPATISTEATTSLLQQSLPHLRPNYLLFPSGIEWRKNIERTLDAYAALPPDIRAEHQLVMVCRTNDAEEHMLAEMTRSRKIEGDFLATGYVSDDDLVRLYQAARLVVFPSLYEGFGLPVLEARRCGTATICSDSSSLREVQPDPTARFDPYDVAAITDVLEKTLGSESEIDRLRRADIPPFTWAWGAERVAGVVRQLESARTPRSRLRVGFVTPLPPQRSGIASYACRLLEPLAERVEITVFVDVDPGTVTAPPGVAVHRISELPAIERIGGAFDSVVYFLGNSEFHVDALQMLRVRPGIVLMHEARMTGLYQMQLARHPESQTVGAHLSQWYPGRYREEICEQQTIDPAMADRFGVLMCREIATHATKILTHSQFAADLIRLDTGVSAEVVFPIPVAGGSPAPGAGATNPVVSTFGNLSPMKRPDLILDAFAIVIKKHADAVLRFVGSGSAEQVREVELLAQDRGLQSVVEVTGRVSDDIYAQHAQDTTVAIQLRLTTNGESSAAIADLVGLGVPVIASETGAFAELPSECVSLTSVHVTAEELADQICVLIEDRGRRGEIKRACAEYAAMNTYQRAAERLEVQLSARSQFESETQK